MRLGDQMMFRARNLKNTDELIRGVVKAIRPQTKIIMVAGSDEDVERATTLVLFGKKTKVVAVGISAEGADSPGEWQGMGRRPNGCMRDVSPDFIES